jgi:hypothetical protein
MECQKSDKYLDLKALAEYSSMSVSALRGYINDSSDPIPSFILKRKILIKKSEFDHWMDRHRTDSGKVNRIVNEVLNEFNTPQ